MEMSQTYAPDSIENYQMGNINVFVPAKTIAHPCEVGLRLRENEVKEFDQNAGKHDRRCNMLATKILTMKGHIQTAQHSTVHYERVGAMKWKTSCYLQAEELLTNRPVHLDWLWSQKKAVLFTTSNFHAM